MMKSFTKTLSALFTMALVVSFSFSLQAQQSFQITSPAGIAGEYGFVQAGFGGDLPNAANPSLVISAELELVDDGVDPGTNNCEDNPSNDLTGKIAVIDRGDCSFDVKCWRAQNNGAIAAIVCNNEAGDPIVMGEAAPDTAAQITIPCVMISQSDCMTIRAEIPTVTGEFSYNVPGGGDDEVLWAEGGFDGGIGNWETVGLAPDADALWMHATGAPSCLFSNVDLPSPTVGDGFMILYAESYQTSDCTNSNIPGPPYDNYQSELISPVIDCSTFDAVSLKFFQRTRILNGGTLANNDDGTTYFSTSIDGGTTWSDPVRVNDGLAAFDYTPNDEVEKRYFLPDFAGQPNCRVKFIFDGDFYFWAIDDVQLIRPENNNMRVNSNFVARYTNAQVPASQVEGIGFLADIYNAGGKEQTNVNLNVTATDAAGTVLYTGDLAYGTIAADSLAENQVFADKWTPPSEPGVYTVTYELTADSTDFDPSDNVISYQFEVTDSTFAKETGRTRSVRPADGNWVDPEPYSWKMGNYYYVANGDDYVASSVTIGLTNPQELPNKDITVFVYAWDDANEDGQATGDERTAVGIATYTITGNEAAQVVVNLPLFSFPDFEPNLKLATGDYIVMVEYIDDEGTDGINFFLESSDERDYNAGVFLTEPDDPITPEQEGGDFGPARYALFLQIGSEDEFNSTGFGRDLVPLVRLNMNLDPDLNTADLSDENEIKLYPNPASEIVNLELGLTETAEEIFVEVLDATGRQVAIQVFDNVLRQTVPMDVSQLPVGQYMVRVVTDAGQRTLPLIVNRP